MLLGSKPIILSSNCDDIHVRALCGLLGAYYLHLVAFPCTLCPSFCSDDRGYVWEGQLKKLWKIATWPNQCNRSLQFNLYSWCINCLLVAKVWFIWELGIAIHSIYQMLFMTVMMGYWEMANDVGQVTFLADSKAFRLSSQRISCSACK